MRPVVLLGARKDKAPTPPLDSNMPQTLRMATEEDLEGSSKKLEPGSDSTFGVRSLQDTIYEGSLSGQKADEGEQEDEGKRVGEEDDNREEEPRGDNDGGVQNNHEGRRRSTLKPRPRPQTRDSSRESIEQFSASTGYSSPSQPSQENHSPPSMSQSLASLSFSSQAPLSSIPSSPKSTSNRSFRHSDEESMDDGGSQAIASSEDDDAELRSSIQDSAPQLIMPSIKMPSRRPFTERGKGMGRLKVMIAGDSGVGKTSLIKSIVQTCEDIVHVDALSPNPPSANSLHPRRSTNKPKKACANSTNQITEVYASTRPYPTWWSDIQETKILRRRKSMGDTVLERNLCFVDTPGYSSGIPRIESIELVLQYIEEQFTKSFCAANGSEGDLVGLLSGSGGFQVDVVFYLIAQDIKNEDIVFLQRLTALTNIIPLIAKSDTVSPEEIEILRRSTMQKLQHADVSPFTFDAGSVTTPQPYSICSAPSDDNDNMDASMLMSPDYVQPLIPSELVTLIQQIFDTDNIACLRHLAAKKLVQAQRSKVLTTQSIVLHPPPDPLSNHPLPNTTPTLSALNGPQAMILFANGLSPYAQAKIADHTQREEKLAQIRLAKWAADLQKSLQNEREKYEAIARGERAIWLKERIGECINDGSLLSVQGSALTATTEKVLASTKPDLPRVSGHRGLLDAGDPLGLLRWNETIRRRGWIAFQVLGGVGIGAMMAVWIARTLGIGNDGFTTWRWEWIGGRP